MLGWEWVLHLGAKERHLTYAGLYSSRENTPHLYPSLTSRYSIYLPLWARRLS